MENFQDRGVWIRDSDPVIIRPDPKPWISVTIHSTSDNYFSCRKTHNNLDFLLQKLVCIYK